MLNICFGDFFVEGQYELLCQNFTNRRWSAYRTKTDILLDGIFVCLYTMDDKGHLPKITMNSIDLLRMPVVAMCDVDSIYVSARISLMEKVLNVV